jgi:SAM-dependent methyltransferase
MFPKRDKFNLSAKFCHGSILEIGALSEPAKFDRKSKVKYADVNTEDQLRNVLNEIPIPNLYSKQMVKLDFVLTGPKYGLTAIDDNSFDAVYSSHVLEHCPNFLFALKEQIRVTRHGGHIYAVVPNKKFMYDRKRQTTSLQRIIERFEHNIFTFSFDDALELVTQTVDHPLYVGKGEEFALEILKNSTGMHHFHVFDEKSLIQILDYVQSNFFVSVKYFSSTDINMHFCLEKNLSASTD